MLHSCWVAARYSGVIHDSMTSTSYSLRMLEQQWWMELGACRGDYGLMYPTNLRELKAAVAVCNSCPVKAVCGEYALEHHECYGVWGGMSERERRRISRARSASSNQNQ